MPLLIGMDEAGYGPNFGPLVVSVTCWQVTTDLTGDLWTRLRRAVRKMEHRRCNHPPGSNTTRRDTGSRRARDDRLVVDDSKRLYSAARGRTELETNVLPFLLGSVRSAGAALTPSTDGLGDKQPLSLNRLCHLLDALPSDAELHQPWWAESRLPLPRFCDAARVKQQHLRLQRNLAQASVKLLAIRSRVICPEQFNALLRRERSKATLLSRTGIELLRHACEQLPPGPVSAVADKHGGRNYYHALLQDAFPDAFVFRLAEGRRESQYRVPRDGGALHVRFQQGADARHLPVALASMVSKYLRELYMDQFNRFWTRRIDGLKPTAGYPTDAPRFWKAIRPLSEQMGIPSAAIWRER